MPIYKYACGSCSLKFEEIVKFEDSKEIKCPSCGGSSDRLFPDSFSVKTTLDPKRDTIVSPKEIDKVVGADADKKREIIEKRKNEGTKQKLGFDEKYHDTYRARQEKRRQGREPQEIEIPKDADGKYTPLKHLGDEKEKRLRNEFSEALTEHRAKREEKGLSQFDGKGAID
jgi:putative FmdB family regulatory protein